MSYDELDDCDAIAEGIEERRRSRIDTSDPQNYEDWMDEEEEDDEDADE